MTLRECRLLKLSDSFSFASDMTTSAVSLSVLYCRFVYYSFSFLSSVLLLVYLIYRLYLVYFSSVFGAMYYNVFTVTKLYVTSAFSTVGIFSIYATLLLYLMVC